MAVITAVVAVPAQTGEPLSPPVIHEVFTPLSCPKDPHTTLALEGCAEKAILSTDRRINAQVKIIFGLLTTRGARETFVESERSWLRYRKASCTVQASFYDGGSGQPVVYASCVAARNRTHLTDLAALRETLSQH